jgi:predicted ribosome quality control (RQC) complex YloA/Tae2 family protein
MIFRQARPVWQEGQREKFTITLGFYTKVKKPAQNADLRVATSGFYRVMVNGKFVYYGPIRCAHGHYRADEVPLTAYMTEDENHIAVEVVNYYDPECKPLLIELDVKLSPGGNAQRYFKLYQKARSARNLAAEQKAKTEEELNYLQGQLENLGKCTEEPELFEIRTELEQQGYVRANHNRRQIKNLPPSKPLKFISSEGIIILVGKNNLQNDKLTGSAQPNEIWMHAKDMPGSHVIIVSENPGEQTMEEAASLAAWYSSGRTSGRVPIDYTRRRYVKKPGGAKPGFVIYTHQKTIIAQPRERLDDKKI